MADGFQFLDPNRVILQLIVYGGAAVRRLHLLRDASELLPGLRPACL